VDREAPRTSYRGKGVRLSAAWRGSQRALKRKEIEEGKREEKVGVAEARDPQAKGTVRRQACGFKEDPGRRVGGGLAVFKWGKKESLRKISYRGWGLSVGKTPNKLARTSTMGRSASRKQMPVLGGTSNKTLGNVHSLNQPPGEDKKKPPDLDPGCEREECAREPLREGERVGGRRTRKIDDEGQGV